jgi:hypothetical protein
MTARALILEPKDCTMCIYGAGEQGQYTGRKVCTTCNGTGNGIRGGRGKCRGKCFGRGTEADFDNPIVCPNCNGNFKDYTMENFCDRAPQSAVLSMPIELIREDRNNTFNENYLGSGTLWSCTDYGTAHESTDEAVMDKVKAQLETEYVQAVKILKPYDRNANVALMHERLVICVTRQGYAIRAVSNA